jgi:hypothetical protein
MLKRVELYLKFLVNKFLRLLKISELFAQERREVTCITRGTSSTESSRDSWLKEEISPIRMEQVARVSMDTNLKMSRFGIPILTKESFQWPMLVLTLMDHNSSSVSDPLLI